MSEPHRAEVWRETRWPYQWIGQCRGCRRGIRCNSKVDAVAFLEEHPVVITLRAASLAPSPDTGETSER